MFLPDLLTTLIDCVNSCNSQYRGEVLIMPIRYAEFTRRPGADRDAFAKAALNACRALKGTNEKVRSSRFYWGNWNTIAMVTDGEPGWMDHRPPEQNAAVVKAFADLFDLADQTYLREAADAGGGERAYVVAGRPSGT